MLMTQITLARTTYNCSVSVNSFSLYSLKKNRESSKIQYLIDQVKNSIHTCINSLILYLILKNFWVFDEWVNAAENGQHFLFRYDSVVVQIVESKRPVQFVFNWAVWNDRQGL